ncbi:MAG: ribulose-phosphate 3-epimerase, partial [Candidatus Binatia bacterium]
HRVKLAPSLIRGDILNLERVFRELEASGADCVHIDLMDGHFAPTLGFPVELVKVVKDKFRIPLDIHLLVEEPGKFADLMPLEATDRVSLHIEAVEASKLQQTIRVFRHSGAQVGLGLKLDTPLGLLTPWLNQVDTVLLLNIPPGAYGVASGPTAFQRVQELKALQKSRFPKLEIEIDGGINQKTVATFARLGADILVCGSIVFHHQGVEDSVLELRDLLEKERTKLYG